MTYDDDDTLERQVYATCKAGGCLCKPDITIDRPDPAEPLFVYATASHDTWCPLYMARQRKNN